MRLFGGTMADGHEWLTGVGELHGYDFQIDGVAIPGLDAVGNTIPLSVPEGSFFSGVLSDGTPFAMPGNDEFHQAVIRDGVGPDFHMPKFEGKLSDEEMWHVVNYVRTLAM